MPTADAVLVLTTLPISADSAAFGRALVDRRLAACVSVLPPMESTYRWKGAVEHNAERQLIIKTGAPAVDALMAAIREIHPYEVPEILVVPVTGGDPQYLEWLAAATT